MNQFSFSIIKQRLSKKQENDIFIIDTIKNRKYTYKLFYQYVEAYIRTLEEKSLPNTVFISMSNSFCLVALYFACIAMEKTLSPIDPNKNIDEIIELVKAIPNSVLITDIQIPETTDFRILSMDLFAPIDMDNYQMPDTEPAIFLSRFESIDFENPCLITYTSGTSGRPKGVIHNLRNLALSAEAFIKHLDIDEKNIFFHTMPMTYMAGILNTILLPFFAGSSIVLTERFSIAEAVAFWKKAEETGANTFWLSPSMLAMLDKTDKQGTGRAFCASNETVWLIGTAPLGSSLKKEFEEKYNVKLYQSYGLSETLFVTSVNTDSYADEEAGVGSLLAGAEIKRREDGELLISVPWMFLGYTNESTDEYFDGMSYISGDIGDFCNESLYITDRKKDLIIRGGLNISPKAIEVTAEGLEGVSEAVVFRGYDSIMGEIVVCAIVASPGFDLEGIKKDLQVSARRIGTGYAIDKIMFLDQMPRNLNGKVDKKLLENLYDH